MKKQGWPSIKEELRDFISFVGKRTASGTVFVPFHGRTRPPIGGADHIAFYFAFAWKTLRESKQLQLSTIYD